jgi:hypothetical protein
MGLLITGVGVALTLDRLGVAEARELMRFWPVVLILFGASMVAQAFQPVAPADAGVAGETPADRFRRRRRQGPTGFFWFVLLIVGLSIAFADVGPRRILQRRSDSGQEERLKVFALMGEDSRQSFATEFHGADMTTIMGQSRLDLRDAVLAPGEEAVVDVFGMMGEVQLLVPEEWIVDIRTHPFMGGVKDQRVNRLRAGQQPLPRDGLDEPAGGARPLNPPRVTVRGFIMMGALVIRSS